MDPRLTAILELRAASQRFVTGEMPFEEFVRALSWHSFDDEDDEGMWNPRASVKDLPQALQAEYLFYVKWRLANNPKGDFRSAGWVYGANSESYGWIDKQRYHKTFSD